MGKSINSFCKHCKSDFFIILWLVLSKLCKNLVLNSYTPVPCNLGLALILHDQVSVPNVFWGAPDSGHGDQAQARTPATDPVHGQILILICTVIFLFENHAFWAILSISIFDLDFGLGPGLRSWPAGPELVPEVLQLQLFGLTPGPVKNCNFF